MPTGTVRARPGIFTLMRARSPRFLPEKCLWGTCAIFARRRRVLWLHFTLVWVAVRVTLAAPEYSGSLPEYSGPAPTVLWVATRVLWARLDAPTQGRSQERTRRSRLRPENCTCDMCALFTFRPRLLWPGLTLLWLYSGSHLGCRSFRHSGMHSCQPCAKARSAAMPFPGTAFLLAATWVGVHNARKPSK